MLDVAFIKECADPSLKPAVVEQFVSAVGSPNPLAITVRSGGRLVLIPVAKTPTEAMKLIRENVGRAVVRVGLTQLPAGVSVNDPSDLNEDLVDPCKNLRLGTKLFGKVVRIVAKWYGNPKGQDAFPQIFEDAVYAWKTGEFDGQDVFREADPGEAAEQNQSVDWRDEKPLQSEAQPEIASDAANQAAIDSAGMRIDLSRIGGK
ncbi:conjugal transfer protein TraH [Rhizobium cauense]|uniref:TraH family protein n=1 Tax=Rhizobium cauense TaxID=1166683 RepID=UPI001C6E4296|nr:TraH family protein [Rhizobium cauense]MBW9114730.1 conjugal transfer protein TraH [Rhizobium cauense]